MGAGAVHREQTRARYPDHEGYAERDGVRIFYEVHGRGEPTILLLPPWSIVHSRAWKMQIPYLSRHARVVVFDGRGNGRSDRPRGPEAYAEEEFAADALAVLDATQTERAVVVGFSLGAQRALLLAAHHPERVARLAFIDPAVPLPPATPRARALRSFDDSLDAYEGWAKFNRNHWIADLEDFARFFFEHVFCEPHSTKQIEDCVGYALQTTPETLADTAMAPQIDEAGLRDLVARVRTPVLVIHGGDDEIRSCESGRALAEVMDAAFVTLEGSGHAPHARDPVKVNRLLRDFACAPGPPRRWARGRVRGRRALYVSSPIGLGHAQRDVAIANELRTLHPDLEVDWLAQHPVSALLEAQGERIHPASALLASEAQHIDCEAADHDLHCFQAWRRMDEILAANFMVFHDVVREQQYDLWIGDEAWELDYYLHENPEEKRAAYVWLTDFVGWLPMPDGGEHEAFLTADYNAEMIEHIERFPRVRDRALFIGDPDDIVPGDFGPGLPRIRDWVEEHFAFTGYVTGFDAVEPSDRQRLRRRLGYGDDEQICIASVGGSAAGESLLRRVIDAYPETRRRVPRLRMIVVAGPRIDPRTLDADDGIEVHAYVPDLHRHLAVCDIAIVHGGLATTMELTANRRPFLYFPLRRHFEQNFHVHHRLARHRAGRRMHYDRDGPSEIAAAIEEEIGSTVDYRVVDGEGAARAGRMIAQLL